MPIFSLKRFATIGLLTLTPFTLFAEEIPYTDARTALEEQVKRPLEGVIEYGDSLTEETLSRFLDGLNEHNLPAVETIKITLSTEEIKALDYFKARPFYTMQVERMHQELNRFNRFEPIPSQPFNTLFDEALFALTLSEKIESCLEQRECLPSVKEYLNEVDPHEQLDFYQKESEKLFKTLAEKGDPVAEFYLGQLLLREQIERSPSKARQQALYQALKSSAEKGFVPAQRMLGLGILIDYQDNESALNEAITLLKSAGDAGDGSALFALATLDELGLEAQKEYFFRAIAHGFMIQDHWILEYIGSDEEFLHNYRVVENLLAELAMYENTLIDLLAPKEAHRYQYGRYESLLKPLTLTDAAPKANREEGEGKEEEQEESKHSPKLNLESSEENSEI